MGSFKFLFSFPVCGLVLRCAFPGTTSTSVLHNLIFHQWCRALDVCLASDVQRGNCRTWMVGLSILLFYNSLEHSELFELYVSVCLTKKKPTWKYFCGLQRWYVDGIFFSSFWTLPGVEGHFTFEVLILGSDLKWKVWSSVVVKHKHMC